MTVNQSKAVVNAAENQALKLNQDGKLAADWGEGDYEIPVIIDMDSVDENGMMAGITKSDLRTKRVCNRMKKVVYVRGSKEAYDAIMSSYSKEFKAEDRDRRCMVEGEGGRLIRCPEQVLDPETGKMVTRSCKDCPYYTSLDKKDFHTATFSDLSSENDQGETVEYEPGTCDFMFSGDRYLKILEDLISHVNEINPMYGEIIRLREAGADQKSIAQSIGKSQPSVVAYLKNLKPIVEEFLENLIY